MIRNDLTFKNPGFYGEAEKAPHGVRTRPAVALELRRLSKQPEYTFFLPFLPLAICPNLPEPVAEYAAANNRQVEIVQWNLNNQLVPALLKRNVRTDRVFGILNPDGQHFLNFAQGMLLEDVKTKFIARLVIERHWLVEPQVSTSQSLDSILASQFPCYSLSIQFPDKLVTLRRDTNPTVFRVIQDINQGDKKLWTVARNLWRLDNPRLV